MTKPVILRKRYIPLETIDISADELLYRDQELLVTRWKPVRPRSDISGGVSHTFLKEGYKISRILDGAGNFIYWYCDIIEAEFEEKLDRYTINDLLLDIRITPAGEINIMDADELAEALEKKLITVEQACGALNKLDKLLKMIYSGSFPPDVCKTDS